MAAFMLRGLFGTETLLYLSTKRPDRPLVRFTKTPKSMRCIVLIEFC